MARNSLPIGFLFIVSIGCVACSSSGDGAGSGGDSGAAGVGGASSGGSSSGGSAGDAGSVGTGGGTGTAGAAGSSGVNLDQLGSACNGGNCPSGLEPVTYCGIAGCSGGSFCSCEITCDNGQSDCPPTTTCTNISDGPGNVCQRL